MCCKRLHRPFKPKNLNIAIKVNNSELINISDLCTKHLIFECKDRKSVALKFLDLISNTA